MDRKLRLIFKAKSKHCGRKIPLGAESIDSSVQKVTTSTK